MVFRPELSWEFLSADEIEAKSVRAVRNHVRHVKEVSPYYQNALFDVFPEDIKTADDIRRLLCTERSALSEDRELFLSVVPEQVVETMVTSGITGAPIVFSYTATDIERLAFSHALSFHSAGITPKDRALLLVTCDRLSLTGMACYRGLTLLGAATGRCGTGAADVLRRSLELVKPTVIVGVPTALLRLAKELTKQGFDAKASSVQTIICVQESIRGQDMELNAVGTALEDVYNAKVVSCYAATESSVSYCECAVHYGGHAHPELVYSEILDARGAAVQTGGVGELVVTPLGVEGVPLVRYRTGDVTFTVPGVCACGRNSLRIGPILGRASQVFTVKGAAVYPLVITNVLDAVDGIEDYVIVVENDESGADRVELHVATQPMNMQTINTQLRAQAKLQLPVLISNVPTIHHIRGKNAAKIRVIDRRKKRAGK